jgi:alkaline phosphatase
LFADKNMPLAIDASKDEPSLADMQQSALSKLPSTIKKNPFLLRSSLLSALCCISANDGSSLEASSLFADKNMPLAIDASKDEPSLADMQQSALSKLERNKKGFFLMVEIEWRHRTLFQNLPFQT